MMDDEQRLTERIFAGLDCGILAGHIEKDGGFTVRYANDPFFAICEYDRDALLARYAVDLTTGVYEDDLPAMRKLLSDILTRRVGGKLVYRFVTPSGKHKWVSISVRVEQNDDGTAETIATYFDVTAEHATAIRLRESEKMLKQATEHAGLMCWRYDLKTGRATLDARLQREFGLPAVITYSPEASVIQSVVHKDDLRAWMAGEGRVRAGARQTVFDARVLPKDGAVRWARFCITTVRSDAGELSSTIGTMLYIDDEKELATQFELEKSRPSLGEENLLAHALINLTTGESLEYLYRDGREVPPEDRLSLADEGMIARWLVDDDEKARFRAATGRQALLACFARGETEFKLDYRRRMPDGDILWVRNILRLLRDPSGTDVLLFTYRYDVDEEILQEQTYRSLASASYDYVVRLYGKTGRFLTIPLGDDTHAMPPERGEDFDAAALDIIERYVVSEDRALARENMLLRNIRERLDKQGRRQFSCRETIDGSVRYKKIIQYSLDPLREIIIVTREDVSPLVRAEMEKNAALATALEAANAASRAKSQFLSRMSHELRTPMNAIIGLSALAAADVDDPAAMEDAIGKIGMSARYLLSLINDILEMSRIESGRMTLNEAAFDFERLLSAVNAIIYRQASDKDVDYDAIIAGFTETVYVGDATKLQQILINVLGNAVKFTNPGGKVTLQIEQIRRAGDKATLRFTVSDTGVGIDEKFLPHLFDVFSQEESSFTSASTGTGLGLAITKSMLDMMNGRISVRSIKNIGSVFTIEVTLGVSEESGKRLRLLASMNLQDMKALIVDDDVIVCQTTENILQTMGMRAEWVTSGAQAIERVACEHRENRDFDTIFVDWKMPEMDGIETTRQIRRIVGPDVTIIIITAYDWKSIEGQAREAGVDLFMEKPLMQSSVVSAFERIFSQGGKAAQRQAISFDFTGRRLLLAEDHPLNVEVAKRMLEKVGAEVVLAANGLEALEAFATAEPNFFDAILMDIRMPVMDGLTAARNIRSLKKQGSKTVPIIAMTANAFDEDVELSLAHGMDAHIIKPLDPQLLCATLLKLMLAHDKRQ